MTWELEDRAWGYPQPVFQDIFDKKVVTSYGVVRNLRILCYGLRDWLRVDGLTKVCVMFRRLISWLTVSDYEEARDHATRQIVARLSRGNITAQNGKFIEEDELKRMSETADRTMERLKKHAA